jgi:hypothetical protein
MWLIDQVAAEMDSLYNANGATLAYPRDLNLNDMFFKYFRINPDIIKDEQGSPINWLQASKEVLHNIKNLMEIHKYILKANIQL